MQIIRELEKPLDFATIKSIYERGNKIAYYLKSRFDLVIFNAVSNGDGSFTIEVKGKIIPYKKFKSYVSIDEEGNCYNDIDYPIISSIDDIREGECKGKRRFAVPVSQIVSGGTGLYFSTCTPLGKFEYFDKYTRRVVEISE